MSRSVRIRLFGPDVRMFRTCADGYVTGWTVETDASMMEGRWGSMVWKPVGPGARTGSPKEWALVPSMTGIHRTRRAAKARAARLWRQHEARGKARNGEHTP